MRTVAVLIGESEDALAAIERAAADAATDSARLVLLAIHDPEQEAALANRLASRNFVGLKLSQDVARAVRENHRERQAALIDEARELARAAGLTVEVVERQGRFVETVREVCIEQRFDRIYVVRVAEGLLARLFRAGDPLTRDVPCPIVQVDPHRD